VNPLDLEKRLKLGWGGQFWTSQSYISEMGHMGFRFVQKSMTLNDLERSKHIYNHQ